MNQRRSDSRTRRSAERMAVRDSGRVPFALFVFILVALVLFSRLFYLQVIMAGEYSEEARASRTVSFVAEPRRGTIYDRNGNILAISVAATTIYANPSEIEDPMLTANELSKILGGTPADYLDKLDLSNTTFSFIKRRADVEVADQVKELNLKGIYFLKDTRREYPYGEVGGQVIGACNVEVDQEKQREYLKGITGIEAYYDDILSGTPGYYEAEVGADGMPIPGGVHESVRAIDGQDLMLSIDIDLQQVAEASLQKRLDELDTESGTAVVLDGGTGEIYAACSMPLFNPADRSEVAEGATQLKAVSYLFEPGSIFKTVAAMSILETGTMTPDDTIFCPAEIEADGYVISDAHERGDETYSLRQIIDMSSNIGISLATEKMGFEKFYDYILKYNLHDLTGVDYPGEQIGYLADYNDWSRVGAYNITFGQGISLNAMQMTRFYGALVNDGVECTPHFLLKTMPSDEPIEYDSVQVIDNTEAIPEMTSMLRTVVTEGTGKQAAIEGYDVAGKTSTAEIYDEENGGYRTGVYNLAFTGYIANSSSQLVCFVGAHEVYADSSVTVAFKDIMTEAINRYGITSE